MELELDETPATQVLPPLGLLSTLAAALINLGVSYAHDLSSVTPTLFLNIFSEKSPKYVSPPVTSQDVIRNLARGSVYEPCLRKRSSAPTNTPRDTGARTGTRDTGARIQVSLV
jgi:hypothetical protein